MSALSDDHLRRLRIFDEKTDELRASRFAKALYGQRTGMTIRGGLTGPVEAEFTGPDDEAVRAFVLTILLFLQDRDGMSVRAMAVIYGNPGIPGQLRSEFNGVREALNDRLDSDTMFVVDGEQISRRRLLDVFLYGGFAHVEADKRHLYERWRDDLGMMFALMSHEFVATLRRGLQLGPMDSGHQRAAVGGCCGAVAV